MGIILVPFQLVAFIVGLFAIIKSIPLWKSKIIGFKEVCLGLLAALGLFASIILCYAMTSSFWVLGITITLPLLQLFLPLWYYFANVKKEHKKRLASIALFCVAFSCILGGVFIEFIFDLLYTIDQNQHF